MTSGQDWIRVAEEFVATHPDKPAYPGQKCPVCARVGVESFTIPCSPRRLAAAMLARHALQTAVTR